MYDEEVITGWLLALGLSLMSLVKRCSLKSASTNECLVCDINAYWWTASTLLMSDLCLQIQFDFNRNKYFDTKEAMEYGNH